MKVIFLDVDGVLNSEAYFSAHEEEAAECFIDPACVKRLRTIVDAAGAEIVLSSSWRTGWSREPDKMETSGRMLAESLSRCRLEIYDKTPCLKTGGRALEVKLWIKNAPERLESFVILDDYDFQWRKHHLSRRWVQTDFSSGGLQDKDADRAVKILNTAGTWDCFKIRHFSAWNMPKNREADKEL